MRVYIWDFTHDRYYPALVSENATVGRLLSQITPQIVKERGPGRQMVAYLQKTGEQLYRNPQGRYVRRGGVSRYLTLHPWQTLASAGVVENEILVLCYFIQPGVVVADLQERLHQEHEWLKELTAKSDLIKVEPTEGDPPAKYRVILKCKGMMLHPTTGKPTLTANHVMEIYLPAGIPGYPNEAPYVLCLTPHFHPNISPENNMVCIGIERDWESSLDIAWLVTHLADMITYRVYGFEKPYNQKAVKWTKANKAKLPLDRRPLFKEEAAVATPSKEAEEKASFEKPFAVARVTAKSTRSAKAKRVIKKTTAKGKQQKTKQASKAKSPKRGTARSKRK
ncbi:MAG: ubiquitin-conjugating enzyme E2 [Dehalococcoidia bacterium]|nr:ubiquitin-conjugating enzyme E2 [Dehalococcoidia bacterium]